MGGHRFEVLRNTIKHLSHSLHLGLIGNKTIRSIRYKVKIQLTANLANLVKKEVTLIKINFS